MTDAAIFYWMKVKPDGSLICKLDSFCHGPYECLLLGYVNVNVDSECLRKHKCLKSSQVIVSVPGAHSRKPPLGKLLLEHIPGPKPAKCLEFFAREMVPDGPPGEMNLFTFKIQHTFWKKKETLCPLEGLIPLATIKLVWDAAENQQSMQVFSSMTRTPDEESI